MLPGFRFLFAAIVLSMSMLVFGLGAAALLRAAHEEFASKPAWHATPETMFAQQNEATRPVLALLRVDTPAEPKASDNVAAPAAIASTPNEPETIAATKPENSSPPEIPVAETSPQVEATPAQDAPAATDETRIATVVASANETAPVRPEDAAPTTPEQARVPNSPDTDAASMKIATLGEPPVTVARPAVSANPDKSTVKKPQQAKRAKARRKMAHRVRLIAQTVQQPADPFAQPTITVRHR
jgi:hypothetical protein